MTFKSKISTIIEVPESYSAKMVLSLSGCVIYFALCVTFTLYATVRYHTAASILSLVILAAEALAFLRVAMYGLYILFKARAYVAQNKLLANNKCDFNIRILVPCYNEALAIIQETVGAAAATELPLGCSKCIYLCDDGKDPAKRAWIETELHGTVLGVPIYYIADRVHDPNRGNGKSQNLNNALQNHIYASKVAPCDIPINEVVVTLDADMVAKPEFFMRMLPYLLDEQTAIVQAPQHFWNIDHDSDILQHSAKLKWNVAYKGIPDQVCLQHIQLTTAFHKHHHQLDGIMCNGSNHIIRARAMAEAGWWPTWTLTEGVGLAQELAKLGYRGMYVDEALAVGEVPLTTASKYTQYTRFNHGYWSTWTGCRGSLWDGSKTWMQRLTGYGVHREQLCGVYMPVFLVGPAAVVLLGEPLLTHLPWQLVCAWVAMHLAQQAVLQFHLVGRSEPHCRSVVSNWLSNLADCHLFWNVMVGCALTVLRAELFGGQRLKFVVTKKTQAVTTPDRLRGVAQHHADCAAVSHVKEYSPRAAPDPEFPWRHLGVHVVSLLLCVASSATGVARMWVEQTITPSQMLATLWCAHNALPLSLLMLRTLHGDSLLLKHGCLWLPRMFLTVVCITVVTYLLPVFDFVVQI